MVTIQRLILILSLILLVACAAFQTEHEELNFSLDEKWIVGYSEEMENKVLIIDFIREGDDITDWLELLSIRTSIIPKGYTLEKGLSIFKQQFEKLCSGATTWFIIEKNKNSIVYEWKAQLCLDTHSQYGVGKIIKGKFNIFQVIYSTRELLVLPSKRIKWIKKISSAKIEKKLK